MEPDVPVAEDLEYDFTVVDPQIEWDVEPGLQFESATVYITKFFEKTTSNLSVWSDVKYIFGAGQRIARIDSTGVRYFHQDHLRSMNAFTDDSGASLRELAHHMPYGDFWGEGSIGKTVKFKITYQELDTSPEII